MMEPECSAEKERKVEVLIAEVMAGRKGELGQTVSDILAVGFCTLDSLDDIAILVVDKPFAIGAYTGILEHIESADRATFFYALQGNVRIGVLGVSYIIIIVTDEFGVAEIHELVRLCGTDEIHRVGEITGLHWH